MKTLVELPDNRRSTLHKHLLKMLEAYDVEFPEEAVKVNKYEFAPDRLTGWPQTYVVFIEGWGIFGFTDGPLRHEEAHAQPDL